MGKENIRLDKNIGVLYLAGLFWKYGWMAFRGFWFSLGRRNIHRPAFVGCRVRILEKGRLFMGAKTRLHDDVYVDALSRAGVTLGAGVVLGRASRIECSGSVEHVGKGIVIGDRSAFGGECFFGAAGGIRIGSDVIVGQRVRFHSENHRYGRLDVLIREQGVTHKGIVVGDNCWIGAGAVFLDGARVGAGCVVAANAVVAGRFPPNTVIGGVPAKVIRRREGQSGENYGV